MLVPDGLAGAVQARLLHAPNKERSVSVPSQTLDGSLQSDIMNGYLQVLSFISHFLFYFYFNKQHDILSEALLLQFGSSKITSICISFLARGLLNSITQSSEWIEPGTHNAAKVVHGLFLPSCFLYTIVPPYQSRSAADSGNCV